MSQQPYQPQNYPQQSQPYQPQNYPQQPPAGQPQYTGYAEGPGAASAGAYNQQFPGQVGQQEYQQAYPPADVTGQPFQPPAPSPFNQAAPAGGDAWGEPGAGLGGGGDGPALHQLTDRLMFLRPRKNSLKMGTKYQSQEQEEQMIVDLLVLDGPPISAHVNGDTDAQTPFAAGPKVAPFFVAGVRVNKVVLDKLREYHDSANTEATCLARLVKTPPRGQGKPYNDLKAATPADADTARPVYPRWDELKAGAAAPAPAPWGGPVQAGQQAPGQPYQPQGGQQYQGQPQQAYQPQPGPAAYPQGPPAGYQQYPGQQ